MSVRSLAVDSSGAIWAGTDKGPYVLQNGQTWTRHPDWKEYPKWDETRLDHLVVLPNAVIAATNQGLLRLAFEPLSEDLQLLQIANTTNEEELSLSASGGDTAINWYWTSDIDGPLCTTAIICELPLSRLDPGEHNITLQIQDRAGNLSPVGEPVTVIVEPSIIFNLYLPAITKGE